MSDPILTDLSTPSLARAVKENLYDFFRFLGRSGTTEMEEGSGWLRWRTPVAHPWFNGVLCSRPPAEGDAAFVECTLAFFRSRSTPAITWWVTPGQPPSEWAPYLQAHGFRFDDSTPGMALDLDSSPRPRLPAGLEIVVVEDEAALGVWADVFTDGYPIPPDMQ